MAVSLKVVTIAAVAMVAAQWQETYPHNDPNHPVAAK